MLGSIGALGWPCYVALSALILVGCSREETAAEPVSLASASGTRAQASPMPLTDYCKQACQRASDCGFERAKRLAQIGGGADKQQVEAAGKSLKEHYFSCKRRCEAKPVSVTDEALYARAVACLSERDCKVYEACLNASDRKAPRPELVHEDDHDEDE